MAVYQNSTANLGVKLEITHASPDVANNRTTITYKASVYKTGSHNPWNNLSQTPMYLTINGQSLHSTATGNYDLRSSTYQQVIKTGTLVIPHNTDGSKSFTFSWNVNFTSTGYGYGNVTTSGTYVLPNIARASTFTIPSTTITTGSAFTVTINKASDGFRHKVAYIVGSSENEWITNADKTYSATIPHSLFNAHKSAESVSGVIRVTTMNGTTVVGSNQQTVTINLASSAIPSFSSVTYTNSNKGMFSRTDQFIRGLSRATATVNTPLGSYSSTISSYEFRYRRKTSYSSSTSKTTNSHQFDAFNFPDSGSENEVFLQARVRDSRGRYSSWKETTDIRVHYYTPPVIGNMTVRRTGSGNTTLQVTRNYTVLSMYELGGSTNSNTASLSFQHRTKGTTSATNNTGAKSTTMFLTNSNANLAGTFAANTSYEVRAILTDKLNTVYGSWISVGTEFVPMDIGPKGVGVGKVHSDASYDLEVGSGGATIDGPLKVGSATISSSGVINYSGSQIQLKQLTAYNGNFISQLSSTANFNDDTNTGFSHMAGVAVNSPGGTWGILRSAVASNDHISQIFHERDGLNKLYTRAKTNGNWRDWNEVAYATGTQINANQNLNDGIFLGNGRYFSNANATMATVSNSPDNSAGYMEVFNTGTMVYQTWYSFANNNIYYRRRYTEAGTHYWSSWSQIKQSSGSTANGMWYTVNDLQICTQNFSIAGLYSAYTLTGTWTYPKSFTGNPIISATPRTNLTDPAEIMNGTLSVLGTPTSTSVEFSWMRQTGANFTSSSRKYLTVFAIGQV